MTIKGRRGGGGGGGGSEQGGGDGCEHERAHAERLLRSGHARLDGMQQAVEAVAEASEHAEHRGRHHDVLEEDEKGAVGGGGLAWGEGGDSAPDPRPHHLECERVQQVGREGRRAGVREERDAPRGEEHHERER